MVADALSVLACGTGHGIDMGNSGIYRKRRSSRNPDRRCTSRPVERDPSKADDSIPGSDPVSGKSSRLADSWNLGELSPYIHCCHSKQQDQAKIYADDYFFLFLLFSFFTLLLCHDSPLFFYSLSLCKIQVKFLFL